MIGKIFKSKSEKPCVCSNHYDCSGCTKKRSIDQYPDQGPTLDSEPIVIINYSEQPQSPLLNSYRRSGKQKPEFKKHRSLCQWYHKRKALCQLKYISQSERKQRKLDREDQQRLERDILRRDLEREYLEHLNEQYEEQLKHPPLPVPPKVYKAAKSTRENKTKSAFKPKTESKRAFNKRERYHVKIKEPTGNSESIVIRNYRGKPHRSTFSSKRRWGKQKSEQPVQQRSLYHWYRKRKAINELKSINRSEQKQQRLERKKQQRIERDKVRRELEREYLERLNEQYEEQLQQPPPVLTKKAPTWIKKQKTKSVYVKPKPKFKRAPTYKGRHQIFIEEPRHLSKANERTRDSIPIVISPYKEKPHRFNSNRRWGKQKSELPVQRRTICQWYRKRKALNELKSINRLEQKKRRIERENLKKLERDRARRELEREYLEQLTEQYEEQLRLQPEPPPPPPKKTPKTAKKQKVQSAYAKPQTETRYVSVKRRSTYSSLSNRCTNFCYRICCQFYCCVTFIMIISFFVIIAA